MTSRNALFLVLASFACGGEAPDRLEPNAADAPAQVKEGKTKSALVRWTRHTSTCEQDDLRPAELTDYGTVTIDGDRIELGLSGMPDLTGTLDAGRADIFGVTTFWVDEEVTCTVDGVAETQQDNLVVAQVTEALTSESSLNCVQTWSLELEY